MHDLDRFVRAQTGIYDQVCDELRAGRKTSHWMWFIFPQIAGLGRSSTAQYYAIGSIEEARAYLAHPLLGARFRECVDILQSLPSDQPERIFGAIDANKLRSSLTLFGAADPVDPAFSAAIARWFGGRSDEATLRLLQNA